MRKRPPKPDRDPLDVAEQRAGTAPVPISPGYQEMRAREPVRFVRIKSRPLSVLSIGQDFGVSPGDEYEGAIVWIKPEPDLEPEHVQAWAQEVREAGAVRVKVLPADAADAALPREAEVSERASASIREIVRELFEASRADQDVKRAALEIVEQELSKVGI